METLEVINTHEESPQPASGWACVALGVGFIVFLGLALVGVRMLAG